MPAGTPTPFVVTNPRILIAAESWSVAAARVSLIPNPVRADISVFTNPQGERESSVAWDVEIDFKQSYGTDSTWTDLSALTGTQVAMEIGPSDAAAAADNPIASFNIWFPTVPFINAAIGQATEWTLSERVIGAPTIATS